MIIAAGFVKSKDGSHVSSSILLYPRRVLIETGIFSSVPSLAAATSSRAKAGFFISAAPAPCFSIVRSGHPILISTPSNPNARASAAARRIISGCAVKNWATIGRSLSVNERSRRSASLPPKNKPSAETNSVHITSGPPTRNTSAGKLALDQSPISCPPHFEYFAIKRRNGASVTSAMGAKTKNGLCSVSQKPFIGTPYHREYPLRYLNL